VIGGVAETSIAQRPQGRLRSAIRIVAINAGLIVAGLVILELAFGHWFTSYVVPDPRLIDRRIDVKQTLYQPPSVVSYSRDQFGLRAHGRPPAAIELVTVGGSTTAQSFISDGETWQDVIAARDGIVIANAGVDGMSLQSAPEILEDWLDQIPGLKARYFLHYHGVNDAALVRITRSPARRLRNSWSRRIDGRSAIYQAFSRLRDRFKGPSIVSHSAVLNTLVPVQDMAVAQADLAPIKSYIANVYTPDLREVLDLHRRRGETAILVTQPTNPALILHKDGAILVSRPDIAQWATSLDLINRTTIEVCHAYADMCRPIDLAGELMLQSSDFYDMVHNTPPGARKIGEFLAARLTFIKAPR
jgi:hypothetical protein